MAEEFLHAPQIRPCIKKMRGIAVPQLVWRQPRIQPSGRHSSRVQRIGPPVPHCRAGSAAEVAAAIAWLLSDASSYVTGALLDVSGAR